MKNQGFTLVELLVSIAIFTVVTTVAVFNHSQFNSGVLITNLAYEIALTVRQAQFYGITVRQGSSSNFDSGYGLHFDTSSPTSYILFEDKPPLNHVYSSGEAVESFALQKGNKISKICVRNNCTSSGDFASVVDVSFMRPNPDTFITTGGTDSCGSQDYCSQAILCVTSPAGTHRRLVIEYTGQIYVSAEGTSICN